jgi:predicted Zn-dependent protease
MHGYNRLGYYQCINRNSAGRCRHGHVIYNQSYSHTYSKRKSVACHEVGHSVGLAHGANDTVSGIDYGCMAAGPEWEPVYRTHNIYHINGWY